MYVSGLTLESKKKITGSRKSQLPKDQQRPPSTQFPDIYEPRALTSAKLLPQPPRDRSSHQKALPQPRHKAKVSEDPVRHYVSETRAPLQKKQSRDNRPREAPRRTKKLQLNKTESQECQFEQETSLLAFYRYAPISFIAAASAKEQLMRQLTEKGDCSGVSAKNKKKKGLQPIWQKLTKLALLKGKYKFREKFNPFYSPQLKALNYKKKEQKKKKESSSSSSDDDQPQKKERCRDLDTWKKSKGVEGSSKVFIVKGRYRDLRNALIERGWVENQDKMSQFYDLKWTTKVSDVNFQSLRPHQIVNHFNNNACLTSKYGIIKSLRSIMHAQQIDVDRFFPKCFDISDHQDFQNFLQVYKWVYATSALQRALVSPTPPTDLPRLAMALVVALRRLLPADKLLSAITGSRFHLCTPLEWRYLTLRENAPPVALAEWDLIDIDWQALQPRIRGALEHLEGADPQLLLDGTNNIWIAKPAFLSRGRGIKCISELQDLLDYSVGKETQYVLQKYIENPLIINRRKFDIRQWVIVQEYNPPRIWFYGEFYLRFCLEDYDPAKLGNRFAHLTNNSVQKHNSKVSNETLMNESMWTMQQLQQYVQKLNGEGSFKTVVAKMREIVVATILGTQDQVYGRRGSFQLIGYDFMIDDRFNPWLIEVNSSPSMDYSTPVTRRLVKMVLEDTVKVMVDERKKKAKKRGLFKLIYDGETPYQFKHYRMEEKKE